MGQCACFTAAVSGSYRPGSAGGRHALPGRRHPLRHLQRRTGVCRQKLQHRRVPRHDGSLRQHHQRRAAVSIRCRLCALRRRLLTRHMYSERQPCLYVERSDITGINAVGYEARQSKVCRQMVSDYDVFTWRHAVYSVQDVMSPTTPDYQPVQALCTATLWLCSVRVSWLHTWVIPRQIDRELVLLTPYPLRIFRNFGSGVVLGVDFDFDKLRLVKLTVT